MAGMALASSAWSETSRVPAENGAKKAAKPEVTYLQHCGMCHLPGGTGTRMLRLRLGEEGSLLAERNDLPGEYVEYVVRHGINSMPPITRADVTDKELAEIVAYLTRQQERGQ
ncbi:MAG: hypothetical protein BGO57_13905 [Sphingomonadales bacterium 63-6]|nr:MAG: hypothetical protein BGO57_13905 [Sphingomonadales bacterium 63-6]